MANKVDSPSTRSASTPDYSQTQEEQDAFYSHTGNTDRGYGTQNDSGINGMDGSTNQPDNASFMPQNFPNLVGPAELAQLEATVPMAPFLRHWYSHPQPCAWRLHQVSNKQRQRL